MGTAESTRHTPESLERRRGKLEAGFGEDEAGDSADIGWLFKGAKGVSAEIACYGGRKE